MSRQGKYFQTAANEQIGNDDEDDNNKCNDCRVPHRHEMDLFTRQKEKNGDREIYIQGHSQNASHKEHPSYALIPRDFDKQETKRACVVQDQHMNMYMRNISR